MIHTFELPFFFFFVLFFFPSSSSLTWSSFFADGNFSLKNFFNFMIFINQLNSTVFMPNVIFLNKYVVHIVNKSALPFTCITFTYVQNEMKIKTKKKLKKQILYLQHWVLSFRWSIMRLYSRAINWFSNIQ